jgi:acyl-ACP thioesterase
MHSHVNNTKYIEWILDLIPYEAMKAKEIDELQVSFASEVNFGDEIQITGYAEGEVRYYFEGYNRTKDIKAFQLEIKMR